MYAVRNLDKIKINTVCLLQSAISLCPNECVISFCNPEKKGASKILNRKQKDVVEDDMMYICMICKLKTDLESITEHRAETFHEFKSEKSQA